MIVHKESGDLKARSSVYKDIFVKHAVDFGKKTSSIEMNKCDQSVI